MNEVKSILIGNLVPSKLNPRKSFDADKMKELKASIVANGILQPIIVRPITKAGQHDPTGYEIVCGERRYRVMKDLGFKDIPARVMELTDEQASEVQIVENLQREDIGAIEEAKGFDLMMKKVKGTAQSVADRIGKKTEYVKSRLKLLELPAKVQAAIADDTISPAHGLVISRLQDPKEQEELLKVIVREKLSVRAAENALNERGVELNEAPFNPGCCTNCESNGSKMRDFFDKETNLRGRCLKPECFRKKCEEFLAGRIAELKKTGQTVLTKEEARKKFKECDPTNFDEHSYDAGKKYRAGLGKYYADKCAKCESRTYLIEHIDEYDRNSPLTINEYCWNPRCIRALCGGKKPAENGSMDAALKSSINKQKAANRVHEAKVKFWIATLLKDKDPHVIKVVAADRVLSGIRESGAATEIFAKHSGKKVRINDYCNGWDYESLYALSDEKLAAITQEVALYFIEHSMQFGDYEALEYFSVQTGHNLIKEFRLTEPYLKGFTMDGLEKLAKELNMAHLPAGKTAMVNHILKNAPIGKVPKEIVGGKK